MLGSGKTSDPPEEPEEHSQLREPGRFVLQWSSRQLQVTVAVLALVACIAVLAPHLPGRSGVITSGSYSRHSVSNAEAPGTSAAKSRSATTKLVPRTSEQLATEVHVPANIAVALRTWDKGPGGKTLAQISNDVGIALQSGGMKIYGAMKTACENLAMSINAAGTSSPIPDEAMQIKYSSALSVLAKGAANCRSAISERPEGDENLSIEKNPTLLHLAQSELGSGIENLFGVTSFIAAARAHA